MNVTNKEQLVHAVETSLAYSETKASLFATSPTIVASPASFTETFSQTDLLSPDSHTDLPKESGSLCGRDCSTCRLGKEHACPPKMKAEQMQVTPQPTRSTTKETVGRRTTGQEYPSHGVHEKEIVQLQKRLLRFAQQTTEYHENTYACLINFMYTFAKELPSYMLEWIRGQVVHKKGSGKNFLQKNQHNEQELERFVRARLKEYFVFALSGAGKEENFLPIHTAGLIPIFSEGKIVDAKHAIYDGSVLEMMQKGIDAALGNPKLGADYAARYTLEMKQFEHVLELINLLMDTMPHTLLQELATIQRAKNQNEESLEKETDLQPAPEGWIWYKGAFPVDIEKEIHKQDARGWTHRPPALISAPVFAVYPLNGKTYKAERSFWNVYRLCFVPSTQMWFVLEDQFFNDLSHEGHIAAMRVAAKLNTTQSFSNQSQEMSNLLPTESSIMNHAVVLNPIQYNSPEEFLMEFLKLSFTENQLVDIRMQQQRVLALFESTLEPIIENSAELLTDIFWDLWIRLVKKQISFEDLEQTILTFSEVVLNTLLQKRPLDITVVWNAYVDAMKLMSTKKKSLTQRVQERNSVMAVIASSPSMVHVLNQVGSLAGCIAGTPGGILTQIARANAASVTTIASPGGVFTGSLSEFSSKEAFVRYVKEGGWTREQQIAFIGKKRWEKSWHAGECVKCHHHRDMSSEIGVGECGICFYCEFEDTMKDVNWDSKKKVARKDTEQNTTETIVFASSADLTTFVIPAPFEITIGTIPIEKQQQSPQTMSGAVQ